MTTNWQLILIGVIGGVLTAARADIRAFVKAREEDAKARFDFALALARWVEGAIIGALPGLGISAATGD